jgi:hypothetical protein
MRFATHLMATAVIFLFAFIPARAQEIEVGRGVVCDTQKQVERFVALLSDDAEMAVEAVNKEEKDPTACVVATIAYVRGREVAMARNRTTAYRVVRILVLGVFTERGMQAAIPGPFYSIEPVDERDA